jgi:ferritin
MRSQALLDAMNEQITHELFSAYSYLSLSAWCEASNLPGLAHWMRIQAEEEIEHAMKFFHFILDRGGRVRLQSIAQPPVDCDSPLDVFEKALAGEQRVTGLIDNLYALAVREQDFAGQNFLNWFVEEQVEEEKIATQVIETLKLIGNDKPALVMLDRELANRSAGGE